MRDVNHIIKEKSPWLYLWWLRINQKRFKAMHEHAIRNHIDKQYQKRMGHNINWDQPERYTEKMQVFKLTQNTPFYRERVDKISAKEIAEGLIGADKVIKTLGVWRKSQDIDLDTLPSRFVLKTNHTCGNGFLIDKSLLSQADIKRIYKCLDAWLQIDWGYSTGDFELQYTNVIPKIYAEAYMIDTKGDLKRYRFICFSGKPYFVLVDEKRFGIHHRSVYDMSWRLQFWNQAQFQGLEAKIPKPLNFECMIDIAGKLSKDIPQVCIDLYNIDGQVYFEAFRFTDGQDMKKFTHESIDLFLGLLWGST